MSTHFLSLLFGSPLADPVMLLLAGWLCFWGILILRNLPGQSRRAPHTCRRCTLRDSFRSDLEYGQ